MSRNVNRRISIKDVARAAGVSIQTVSRVVNESELVASSTREVVQKAIQQLGYRRSETARNLTQGRSRMLGVVIAGRDILGGCEINSGITAEAEALGYSLLLKERQKDDFSSPIDFIQSLLDRQVDGILWMLSDSRGEHGPILQQIVAEYGVPVVALVRFNSAGVPFSAFDNFGAGVMATRHLIERGKRQIVHIAGLNTTWDAQERLRGWRFALEEAGLPAGDERVYFGNWLPESGALGLRALLDRVPDLDAAFMGNDMMALGAMCEAHRLGKRIPQDIAFVGVDGITESCWFHPPLTTVMQNQVIMGQQAVRMLSRFVEAKFAGNPLPQVEDYLYLPELIVRESS